MDALRLDQEQLRDAMRFWGTGVAIVSSTHDGEAHGMTVNSFTALSLEPPLVLVAIEKQTRTHGIMQKAGSYAVSILDESQKAISERFAGRDTEQSNRFLDLETKTFETGSPILSGALAFFDCRVRAEHDTGTHTLFIGEVILAGQSSNESSAPLIYYNRDYRSLV